ncbi:hypothetical protein EJ04DRAFT_534776 [Polyplosphaeria fusca]|uniref:Zn(2)-C6 fungal-type domain-containing protein n=1 Tax=Polyplosphaeria fusca TaxID=682080 RepID=A0A9P4R0K3_9PLEO|nr:hypothetical protein EJ04DRAFT_534776 [Polyplosphaeria fusca]
MDAREGRIGNAFACERCRKHKVRCVPSDAPGLCQRCQKARVECIEHVARRRPAKPRTVLQTPSRVAEMEAKLDKLSAIVTAASTPTTIHHPALPPLATLPSQVAEIAQRTPTPAPIQPAVSAPPVLPNPGSTPESAWSFWESINDTISGLGRLDPTLRSINVTQMGQLLANWRTMVNYFPFVALPQENFCRDLLQKRPILMFAVLTAASYDSTPKQLILAREFRKVVMIKLMSGEKSLDLLQGLLVFIAWHHHYMDSKAVSVHMLLQICTGIAGDLGLDGLSSAVSYRKEDMFGREAKRAYLGCYYLASNLGAVEAGRTRSTSYSHTHRNYAADLASTPREHESDALLPALVEMCQFFEDVDETFRSTTAEVLVAKSQAKRLSDKWDHIRQSTKQMANEFKTLQWLQLAGRIHLYRAAMQREMLETDGAWTSGFQLSLRISGLRSIEQFLDNSLQLAQTHYEFLSLVDWLNLLSALTTFGKIALHSSPMPGWDPADLQLAKTFEYYRDQLSAQIPRSPDSQDRKAEDVFERFRRVTAVMKMALKNAGTRGSPNGSTFEISTSSRQTVSLLNELPPLKPNGVTNGDLPAFWKVNPTFDFSGNAFPWKLLMGTV